MFDAKTDHKVEAFGENVMKLKEFGADIDIVTANRDADNEPWTIHTDAEGVPDEIRETRSEAVQAMVDMALESLPGAGYSTIIPHGLLDMP